jgi:hypothetical protein
METKHTATEIQAMVRNMDASKLEHKHLKEENPEQYLNLLQKENPILYDIYPAVFALHADDKLDETFFYMLKEKRKMEKGETNEDEASVRVGQKLFNRWVAPIISNTHQPCPTLTYDEYYKQISKNI